MSLLQLKIDAKGDVYPRAQTANNFTDSYGNLFSPDFFLNLKKKSRIRSINIQLKFVRIARNLL